MSRTDIHRPYWVISLDPECRSWWKDTHHHEDGVCDLEETLHNHVWFRSRSCYRDLWRGGAPRLCGCKMCTGQLWRKWGYRKERGYWLQQRKQLLETPIDDIMNDWISPLIPVHYEESYHVVTQIGRYREPAIMDVEED